jgi:hypothetical protein
MAPPIFVGGILISEARKKREIIRAKKRELRKLQEACFTIKYFELSEYNLNLIF